MRLSPPGRFARPLLAHALSVRLSLLLLSMSALAACSGNFPFGGSTATPTPAPIPTPSGIPASDKSGPAEIAAALFPATGSACGHSGDYSQCPLTADLRRRLTAMPIPYVDQLCRCTTTYRSPKFTVTPAADETVVRVDLTLDSGQQSLDLIVTHPLGVWVASDILCAGRGTSTSVFSDAPTLCFASSG
jgi:hypothetical protein